MEISMNHLNIKDFNTKKEILSNVHLKIKDGASLGIVGPSGSGKTTLSNILLGIKNKEMIFEGTVQYMLDEKNIINISDYNWEFSPKIKKKIGYIPQDTMNIFDPVEKLYTQFKETLSENGYFKHQIDCEIQKLLKKLKLPKNILSKKPYELSGSMLQRCTIGLTLALNPDVIIADEPTNSLDLKTKKVILDVISNYLNQKKPILILTSHDYQTIKTLCTEVLVIESGKVQYYGKINEINSNSPCNFFTEIIRIDEELTKKLKEVLFV